MLDAAIASRYALALYDLGKEQGKLEAFEQQLNDLMKVMQEVKELSDAYTHPLLPPEAKKKLILTVFGEEIDVYLRSFLQLLVDKKREPYLGQIVKEYTKLMDANRNMVNAEVTTAIPLNDDQLARLRERLAGMTGKRVRLSTKIEPRIIGGMVVRIGDKIIDGSVATRLASMRNRLQQIQLSK